MLCCILFLREFCIAVLKCCELYNIGCLVSSRFFFIGTVVSSRDGDDVMYNKREWCTQKWTGRLSLQNDGLAFKVFCVQLVRLHTLILNPVKRSVHTSVIHS